MKSAKESVESYWKRENARSNKAKEKEEQTSKEREAREKRGRENQSNYKSTKELYDEAVAEHYKTHSTRPNHSTLWNLAVVKNATLAASSSKRRRTQNNNPSNVNSPNT